MSFSFSFPEQVSAAIEAGYPVVPASMDKIPMVKWKRWQERAQTEDELAELGHGSLWGVVTGAVSGVVVLDFDGPEGLETMRELGLSPHVHTGSGGAHVYVTHPGRPVKTIARPYPDYPGLDIKGDGGIAYFHGRSKKGAYGPYGDTAWPPRPVTLDAPWVDELFPEVPERAAAEHGTFSGTILPEVRHCLDRQLDKVRDAAEGESNKALNKAAFTLGGLVGSGQLPLESTRSALMDAAEDRGVGTPEAVIDAGLVSGLGAPWRVDPPEDPEWLPAITVKKFRDQAVPDPIEFPLDVLPPALSKLFGASREILSCPIDYLGAGVLPIIGLAAGANATLQLNGTWFERPNLWVGLVGKPGSAKSPAMKLLMKPVRAAEKSYRLVAAAEVARRSEAEGEQVEVDPPRLIVDDSTVEALFGVMERNPRGLLLAADELSGWVKGFGQYKGGGGRDRQHWLSMWSGSDIRVDRVTAASRFIEEPFMSVLGGIQHEPLQALMTGADDGLVPRLLLAEGSYVQPRFVTDSLDDALVHGYTDLWNAIRDRTATTVMLQFDGAGAERYRTWANDLFASFQRMPATHASAWSKMPAQCARIALILALAHQRTCVDADIVDRAVALVRYFQGEAGRLLNSTAGGSDAEKRHSARTRAVIRFLEENPGATKTDILSMGPDWAMNPKVVDTILDTVASLGWVVDR